MSNPLLDNSSGVTKPSSKLKNPELSSNSNGDTPSNSSIILLVKCLLFSVSISDGCPNNIFDGLSISTNLNPSNSDKGIES